MKSFLIAVIFCSAVGSSEEPKATSCVHTAKAAGPIEGKPIEVSGVVTDQSGAAVPGAALSMQADGSLTESATNEDGRFCFLVGSSEWEMEIQKAHFDVKRITSETKRAKHWSNLTIKLKPGEKWEVIEVITDSPIGIDTSTSTVEHHISDQEFDKIPHSRNVTDLF